MVLAERSDLETTILSLGVKYSSGIACICTIDTQAIEEHCANSGAARKKEYAIITRISSIDSTTIYLPQVAVIAASVHKARVNIVEGVTEVARNPVTELPRVVVLNEVLVLSQPLFEFARKLSLNISGDFVAIDSVTIAYYKEVEALLAAHVRCKRVRILIDLVGVTRLVSA